MAHHKLKASELGKSLKSTLQLLRNLHLGFLVAVQVPVSPKRVAQVAGGSCGGSLEEDEASEFAVEGDQDLMQRFRRR